MSAPPAESFAITLEDSLAFAELSGDFNPLHVDPVAARRTQFGSTVVHGIHAALRALDVCAEGWALPGLEPGSLSATFQNPVRTGNDVNLALSSDRATGKFRITAESAGKPAFTLNGKLEAVLPLAARPHPADAAAPHSAPQALPFPAPVSSGAVPLILDPGRFGRLLPALHRLGSTAWVADLVATTRIVGMEYPGLDSIYSGFKLTRRDGEAHAEARMSFCVEKVDPRFRLARLSVQGGYLQGTLDTFFRPRPVEQLALADVRQRVQAGAYRGQKSLVVGGTRGLGEIAAKILLAGGAEVTITYARGLSDARRVAAEASAAGLDCGLAELDVAQPLPDAVKAWLGHAGFTHVYFFASPHIERNAGGRWDPALFERFCRVYVHGFVGVAEAVALPRASSPGPRVLYPSSVFLDTDEPGFAEYCAAKAAGEMAARHLSTALRLKILSPRLPRMRTDQTSALMDAGVDDPYPVIDGLVRELAS